MNPHQLQNNNELFDYLVWLSGELKSKGQIEVAEQVHIASRFASGSPSEFFHEAQESLKQVRTKCVSVLRPSQVSELTSVIEQIEAAFKKIGGA
jgi:hypothetical protein